MDALGTARRLPSGSYLLRARTGELSITHGPDPVDMQGAHHQLPGGVGDTPHCISDGSDVNSIVVLYGRHASSPDRRDEFYPMINNAVWRMNAAIRAAALNSGGPAAQIRTPCYSDGVSVRVASFVNNGPNTFAAVKQAAIDAGFCTGQSHCFGSGPRKYFIFYDHGEYPQSGSGQAAGLGECYCMDAMGAWTRSANNWNNTTSLYSVTWRGRTDAQPGTWHTYIPMHELFHTLGAVNETAPQATQNGHCADGIDVMCYDDGGMYPGQSYTEGTCPSANPVAIDCGQDTYFDTSPAPNSWLSSHWQLGWSGNNFFEFDDIEPPDTTITSGPTGTTTATTASFGFSSEPGATFECRLDAGAWAACSSPKGYGNLATGTHTFEVRARDGAANVDPTPAVRTWTIAGLEPQKSRTAHWRLNETSGTLAHDSKGSNDGTYAGAFTLGQAGATGDGDKSVGLDGSSGRITTSYNPFQNGQTRSFEGWAYRDDTSGWHTLVGGSATTRAPILYLPNASTDVVWYSDTGVATQVRWTANAPTGQWFHWAFVFDEAADRAELFVNGASLGSKPATVAYNAAPGNLTIGAYAGSANAFKGRLDDVAVYGRGLSASDVARLYSPGT
ncbi:MAG TPA: LamG domain-containing protein [Thermoleophilaceae bacterium]